ncbi:MATE efflux family protein 4, chloroplastic [Dorcoceras hygrometricum]|uniref:MATE efflux family protein 4, chloroplastic n=1 Tax=Dorcoceras hygrometricum TaxID=472368 RepID=A0A2Z7AYP9_9LAMI|nr:MATE efflux family protein 4, chloroplastic [Dorcoceras hygrometricum]
MGIDQLGFQSVQLGYLKILQLGTQTQTIQKQEKNMRSSLKHRSSRPANQLTVISIEPLYPHSVSTGEIIGPSAITARWFSDTTDQSVTNPIIALYLSGMTHLSAGHNVALSQISPGHDNLSLLKRATSLVTPNLAGTSLELKSVKEISYLSSQLHFSSLIPTVRTHILFYLAKLSATSLVPKNGGIDGNLPEKCSNEQYLSRVSLGKTKRNMGFKYAKCWAALGKCNCWTPNSMQISLDHQPLTADHSTSKSEHPEITISVTNLNPKAD